MHTVQFADYDPSWRTPDWDDMGVSHNSIGVHAPEGLGRFCSIDLDPALQLRRIALPEAVKRLQEELDLGGDVSCRVGSQFGPYRLLRLLGRGQLARVYEAEHTVKRAIVALKVLSPPHSQDRSFRLRMQRNVEAAARGAYRLPGPFLVPIYDWGEIDERPYIEMQAVDGIDLRHLLAEPAQFPPAQALALLEQIGAALDELHSQGWMHRNVRPGNIMVGRDRAFLLCGFRHLATTEGTEPHPMDYAYSAPEIFTGSDATASTDIYALTCVFFESLVGLPPYRADSLEAVVGGHLTQPVPRPSQFYPGIPASIDDVIARGMAKEPDHRYASARALALAARQAMATFGSA
jgi:serine/threonine protein kinase